MDIFTPGDVFKDQATGEPVGTSSARFALSELAEGFHFFNHGAFFAFAGFRDPEEDPVNDWYAQQPKGTEVIKHPFPRAVFEGIDFPVSGFGGLTWNHAICAVRTECWDSLHAFLSGIAATDSRKHRFCMSISTDVEVVDPVLVESRGILHDRLSLVTVTVYGVDATDARWVMQAPRVPVARPVMVKTAPRPYIVELGKQVLGGDVSRLNQSADRAFTEEYTRVLKAGPTIIEGADGACDTKATE
jgi:hypothetical protein